MGLRERTLAAVEAARTGRRESPETPQETLAGQILGQEASVAQERSWNALKALQADGEVQDVAFQVGLDISPGLWPPDATADFIVVGQVAVPIVLEDPANPDKRKALDVLVNKELDRRGFAPIARIPIDLLDSPEATLAVMTGVAQGDWT